MPKILITGCSSGFGLAIAQKFLDGGWDVAATMRTPRNDLLRRTTARNPAARYHESGCIAKAVETAGPIDARGQQCRRRHAQCAGRHRDGENPRTVRDKRLRRDGDDKSCSPADAGPSLRRHRQCQFRRHDKAAPSTCGLQRQQGGPQRIHGEPRARSGDVWHPCQTCVAWLCTDDRLRQKCCLADGHGNSRAI